MPVRGNDTRSNLTDLPVELIAELYLLAVSPSFPLTCKYIHAAIKSLPPSAHARYLIFCHPYHPNVSMYTTRLLLTWSLRYPICTIPVLEAMRRIISHSKIDCLPTWADFQLPKRLFRALNESGEPLDANSEPLPLLRFLWVWEDPTQSDSFKPMPDPNSHNGYPLVRAVFARFIPLVQFLLDHGADPGKQDCLAVKVAIEKKALMMVKMLIEFGPEPEAEGGKRRRRADRVFVTPSMLDLAVKCDARDIVRYFMEEKGCIPSMATLKAIRDVQY